MRWSKCVPVGPRLWKLTLYGEAIGVLVTANPKGLLKERHIAFPNTKASKETKTSRASSLALRKQPRASHFTNSALFSALCPRTALTD